MFFTKSFPLVGNASQETGAVVLEHLWADVYGIKIKKANSLTDIVQWEQAIRLALQEAKLRDARLVMLRLIRSDGLADLAAQLPKLGFRKKHDRVEFRKPIAALPEDDGSPLSWKTAKELSWSDVDVAKLLGQVAEGDPDPDVTEDPLIFIQDMLADPVLTSGLDCFHIGFFAGNMAALTVVQINPKTGWSRISYMGVVPAFRGKHLGKWVHRYSFRVMKAEGGKLYHGGTVSSNQEMIRLFELHQCERFLEMEEWVFPKGGV